MLRNSLSAAIGVLGIVASAQLAYGGDVSPATWRVSSDARKEAGTGFLVDARGYFLTASHVVKRGKNSYAGDLMVSRSGKRYPAQVVKGGDLCDEISDGKRCVSGADLALIKVDGFSNERVEACDLNLSGRPLVRFEGVAVGYPSSEPGRSSVYGPSWFDRCEGDPTGINKPSTSYPYTYRVTQLLPEGYSGGPVYDKSHSEMVLGVAGWVSTNSMLVQPAYSFLTPTNYAYRLLKLIPVGDDDRSLAKSIVEKTIDFDDLEINRLPKMTGLSIMLLIKALPRGDEKLVRLKIDPRYEDVLCDYCFKRALTEEVLDSCHRIDNNLAQLRSDAQKNIAIAAAQFRAGKGTAGRAAAEVARGQYTVFLERSLSLKADWVGPKVLGVAASDLALIADKLGDDRDKSNWVALSYLADKTPQISVALADTFLREGSFREARELYGTAYLGGLKDPHVINGFEHASARALASHPKQPLPIEIKQYEASEKMLKQTNSIAKDLLGDDSKRMLKAVKKLTPTPHF